MFDIEWREHRVALKASNGKYVCTKKNGQLSAVSDLVGKSKQAVFVCDCRRRYSLFDAFKTHPS